MFSFFTSDSNKKSNTYLIGQSITPIVFYSELQNAMGNLFKKKKLKCNQNDWPENSLTNYWNQSKQDDWNLYKNISIKLALQYFDIREHDILELYALLADCRNIIANNLQQPHADDLGKSRIIFVEYDTFLDYTDLYASFTSSLVNKYYQNGWGVYSDHVIKIDNIEVCVIVPQYKQGLGIFHCCKGRNETSNHLTQKIRDEFKVFLNCNHEKDILESVARITYYFALTMPLCRGSAATTEMLIQVLLIGKGLHFEYRDDINMPLDLHAFLSKDIEEFEKIFCSKYINTKKIVKDKNLFFKTTANNYENIVADIQSSIDEFKNENCVIS